MKIKRDWDALKDRLFFTSDTHFFHQNVIRFNSRPFSGIEEMNKCLIDNWNNKVSESDIVFHLGDFTWNARSELILHLMNSLNGEIILIKGNHEKSALKPSYIKNRFSEIHDLAEIDIDNNKIIMCHYPMLSWNGAHRGTLHLHGHSHGECIHPYKNVLDVGVDCNDLMPLSYKDVINKISIHNEDNNRH